LEVYIVKAIGLRIAAVLGAFALAACQSNAYQPVTPAMGAQGPALRTPQKAARTNLYVANASTVTVYRPGSTSVLRKISNVTPTSLGFDKRGDLYVANLPGSGSPVVLVYKAGSAKLVRSITKNVVIPRALAFDSADSLYVGSDFDGVPVYKPYSTNESRLIPVFFPLSLAFDASDNLFVGNTSGPYGGGSPDSVEVFAPGTTVISRTITKGIALPVAVITDSSGNLFAANQSSDDVTVYAPGATSPLRTIHQGIKLPSALAFDRSGNLYVANGGANSVTVYAPGSISVLRTIKSGVVKPKALAIDSAGDVYVANSASVTVYGPKSTSVLRTISSGVSAPVALGFGP
jgi:hypothetical protein